MDDAFLQIWIQVKQPVQHVSCEHNNVPAHRSHAGQAALLESGFKLFYFTGIQKLRDHYKLCIDKDGGYYYVLTTFV